MGMRVEAGCPCIGLTIVSPQCIPARGKFLGGSEP